MKEVNDIVKLSQVEEKILTIHEQQVLLDSDVAELYGVETMRVNEAVKNNPDKFPEGYIIELSKEEKKEVIEKFDNPKIKFSPALPKAFTEKGLYMLATILKSSKATQTTIAIVETFAQIRELSRTVAELSGPVLPTISNKNH
jgi:predicted XRE-type DNA-binding protein